jgi:hypothetical protein
MALYDRLLGRDDQGNEVANRISVHVFQAAAQLWVRGALTALQASDVIAANSGAPLDAGEQVEAQTLVATVTSIAITGSATAQADARARRALRMAEIDAVLLLEGLPGFATPTEVKQKLGV